MPAAPCPPTPTGATGTPGGICTVDRSASSPPRVPAARGMPITGNRLRDAAAPAKVVRQPGGNDHADAVALGAGEEPSA